MGGFLLCLSIWSFVSAGEASTTVLDQKIIWSILSYLVNSTSAVMLYLVIHAYTMRTNWLTPFVEIALFLVPGISFGMAATNSYHRLLWSKIELTTSPYLGVVALYEHGPWFSIVIIFSYTLVGMSLLTFLQAFSRFPYLFSPRHRALLLAAIAPILLNILYVTRPELLLGVDLTPIAFTWFAVWVFVAITRQGFFDFIPVTRIDMLERLREGILLFDAQNRLLEANLAARGFFHLTRSPRGQPAVDLFKNQPNIFDFLSQSRPAWMEITLPRSAAEQTVSTNDSAAPLALQLNLVPLDNEAGKRLGALVTAINVSERHKIEEALRASETRYRLLVENQGEGIVIVTSDETFAFANPAAERIYGVPPGTLAGRNMLDFVPTEQREILNQQIFLGDTGEQSTYELEIQRPDGTPRTLEVTATRHDLGLEGLRASFAIVRDISERKQAERALIQSNTALRARERFLAILNDITRAALEADDLQSMLQMIADQVGALYSADGCFITLWDEEHRLAVPIAAFGPEHSTYTQGTSQPGENTLTEAVLESGRALSVDDTRHSPYLSPSVVEGATHSALGLPLIAGGRKLGAVLVGFDQPHIFSSEEVSMGEHLAGQLALTVLKAQLLQETFTVNKKLQGALEALDHLATTDKLTGANNRHKFDELIQYEFKRLDRYRHPVSLILFDIDHFKEINDAYGHHSGDQVLVEIARTVRKNIRQVDSLVRWGGDEFLILAPNIHHPQAMSMAEKLRAIITECKVDPIGVLTVSIGVTELFPGETPDDAVRRADKALYLCKQNGRNQVELVLAEKEGQDD